jgi:hypothetical protein
MAKTKAEQTAINRLISAEFKQLSRSRGHAEKYFQGSKDDLGLDHCEGRTCRGFRHHPVLSALASPLHPDSLCPHQTNIWCDVGTNSASDPALIGEVDRLVQLLWNKF